MEHLEAKADIAVVPYSTRRSLLNPNYYTIVVSILCSIIPILPQYPKPQTLSPKH